MPGSGKATVYRWWPNKGALVVDAFASSTADELHFPDSGSVYRDMSLQISKLAGRVCARRAAVSCAPSLPPDNPILNCWRSSERGLLRPRRQEAYATLRRGIERGELPRSLDLDLVLDILYGAIYMRFLIRHDELSEDYVKEVCRLVLEGAAGNSSSSHNEAKKNEAKKNDAKKNGAALARRRN